MEAPPFGVFQQLPKDLRLWFFARLNPQQLPKLRRNKELKRFIDDEVYPYIETQIQAILQHTNDFTRVETDIVCSECNCKQTTCGGKARGGGVARRSIYTYNFALNPSDVQPSGSHNISRIDTFHMPSGIDRFNQSRSADQRTPIFDVHTSDVLTVNFALNPEEHQPSGTINWWYGIGHTTFETEFLQFGVCYRCVLVNGLPVAKTVGIRPTNTNWDGETRI